VEIFEEFQAWKTRTSLLKGGCVLDNSRILILELIKFTAVESTSVFEDMGANLGLNFLPDFKAIGCLLFPLRSWGSTGLRVAPTILIYPLWSKAKE
jgi:hypothetical protein